MVRGEAEEKEEVAIKEETAGIAKAVLFINQKGQEETAGIAKAALFINQKGPEETAGIAKGSGIEETERKEKPGLNKLIWK